MGSKTVSIPAGMVFRKFYCHKCGQKLQRAARTFTVRPGDPDYKKYAIHKNGLRITFFPGDVQVTEYDFCCPDCHHVTGYREQQIIAHIQKKVGARVLSQSEILTWKDSAEVAVDRKKRIGKLLWWGFLILWIAVFALLAK